MEDKKYVNFNSDILFIYDAKDTNPNGDPDDENKPRMDYDRSRNLVTDVRLKRYIRDYLDGLSDKDYEIFVKKINGESVTAETRLEKLIEDNKDEILADENLKDLFKGDKPNLKALHNHIDWLLNKLLDVRLFGATMPIKGDGSKGDSITFTGPVQFNWGYSLNKVENFLPSTISSVFSGASEGHGNLGKDYRIPYAVIAFHGIVSAKRGKYTALTEKDIERLDKAMLWILYDEANTRSKSGQEPLLYMRVEYNDDHFFLGDLRKYVKLTDEQGNEIPFDETAKLDRGKYTLDLSELTEKLNQLKEQDKINKIVLFVNEDAKVSGLPEDKNLIEQLDRLSNEK